jgi:hypothetical protein
VPRKPVPQASFAALEKNELKPWQHEHWCLPTVGAPFVAAMEEVLDLYAEPSDPRHPLVCFDEKPVVVHAPTRPPLPPSPGHPARDDYEYARVGTADIFVMVEPHVGWRHAEVTERRTHEEYARCLRWLVDEGFPQAERIRLVQDHLSTHDPASLYATFPPEEARRIRRRLEFHYTPVHGSWLNMAEIEIAIVERGCLSRPLEGLLDLRQRVAALEAERNAQRRAIRWQFTTPDARQKLKRLYPTLKTELD